MKIQKFSISYFDDFILFKHISCGVSTGRVTKYKFALNHIINCDYIKPDDLKTYTSDNFIMLLRDLLISKNWSSSTYNGYRKLYKTFCNYLVQRGLLEKNPFDLIPKRKEPIRLPRSLTNEQVSEVLQRFYNNLNSDDYVERRDAVIIYTLLYTGLRRGELIKLRLSDLNFGEGYIAVRSGKGDKERFVPLISNLKDILVDFVNFSKKYFSSMFDKNIDFVFCSSFGDGLFRQTMDKILHNVLEKVSFNFVWHQLRHTFATHLVRQNFDIYNISIILGHSDINITKVYLSSDVTKLKTQLEKIALY